MNIEDYDLMNLLSHNCGGPAANKKFMCSRVHVMSLIYQVVLPYCSHIVGEPYYLYDLFSRNVKCKTRDGVYKIDRDVQDGIHFRMIVYAHMARFDVTGVFFGKMLNIYVWEQGTIHVNGHSMKNAIYDPDVWRLALPDNSHSTHYTKVLATALRDDIKDRGNDNVFTFYENDLA